MEQVCQDNLDYVVLKHLHPFLKHRFKKTITVGSKHLAMYLKRPQVKVLQVNTEVGIY